MAWVLPLLLCLASAPAARPSRVVPSLPGSAEEKDLRARAFALRFPEGSPVSARVAVRGGNLWLRAEVKDTSPATGDLLRVSFHFPRAGTTAGGHAYRFGRDGKRSSLPEDTTPPFAQAEVQAQVAPTAAGYSVTAVFSPRAMPRFPASDALLVEICVAVSDRTEGGASAQEVSNCTAGSSAGEQLRLPDEFRTTLHLAPPRDVVGLEAQPGGWAGYGALHEVRWLQSDAPITAATLAGFLGVESVPPEKARVAFPSRFALKDGRPLLALITGQDPFASEARCDPEREFRLALYLVKGKTAERILEWPASTCALGRALSVTLEKDGALVIGYSTGSTLTFTWGGERFERTEIGMQ